jgi:hypothetical protein
MVYAAAARFSPLKAYFIPPKDVRPVHLLQRGEVKRPGELMAARYCRMSAKHGIEIRI